ncbi:hypothetical protein ACWFR4_47130, partial [Streptomyces sp. NPDC055140]
MPRLPDLVWDEDRRTAHGKALAARDGDLPPLSDRRRALDPDDPYAQFTDNLAHQLQQLENQPDAHAAVARAAQSMRDEVTDLATRARAYSTERLRTAEHDPAELLQLTLEPSRTDPFIRVAMNAIMHAIDTAEDAVTGARAKQRVRDALTAIVCSSPPINPQGDSARDFADVLVEFAAVASDELDTVAELLAGPAQWAHFADMAARVEAATATPDPHPPAPRLASIDEVRAHQVDQAGRPLPDTGDDPAGIDRHELRGRARYAGELATDPSLEIVPSGRLLIHGSAGRGWHVVAPGSADAIVPWEVKSRRHALRYAALLERLTDENGTAFPWDDDDFPSAEHPYRHPGGDLFYNWITSNQTHESLGFHHRLRTLRETSEAYGWMEDLASYRFSEFDFIHPTNRTDLQPGDEVMFTFDQDELDYAPDVAGYFPPLRGGSQAIGTAFVGASGELIPGFWWPEDHQDQAQRLTHPVKLRDGVRRAHPGEYTLHAGITAHLPELAAHQVDATTATATNGVELAAPRLQQPGAPTAPEGTPAEAAGRERGAEPLAPQASAQEEPAELPNTPSTDPRPSDAVPVPFAAPPSQAEARTDATPAETASPDDAGTGMPPDPSQEQGELFTVLEPNTTAAAAEPDAHPGAAVPAGPAEGEPKFPKLTQAASRALFDIARGDITEANGVFMKRTPTRCTIAKAPSQKAVTDLLDLGLAERVGQHLSLSERGTRWLSHHNIKLPATGLRDTSTLDPAVLPPIDYTPLDHLPVADEQPEHLQPPAAGPLPANWDSRSRAATEAEVQATKDKASAARARAAQSTARDLEELAAGPEDNNRRVWRSQYPLAQYDENAAAALERLTDPVAHAYATQAVHQLRAAIEAVGRAATADYVQRIRGAGTDPMAMDKVWRTTAGIQADDTYRHRVRGIVITYLEAIGAHAEEIGLDWQAIVHILEDAAGWKGGMQPLTLRHQYAHAYFPEAEEVADAAGFVARALHKYTLGESDEVDAWAHLRDTWRTIEPRPSAVEASPTAAHGAGRAVDAPPAQDAPTPAPDPTPHGPVRSARRFERDYRVGEFVDYTDDEGHTVTTRVIGEGPDPILRGEDGHEVRALFAFRQSRFVSVREDDGSALPPAAWTANLPDGLRAVAPRQVNPGDVVHDYRENGTLGTSRLVIEVTEEHGRTVLTTVALEKFSGLWLHYDHRDVVVLDQREHARRLAEAALRNEEVRAFAEAFTISLADVRIAPATDAEARRLPQVQQEAPDQPAAASDAPAPAADAPGDRASGPNASKASKGRAVVAHTAEGDAPAPHDERPTPVRDMSTPTPPGALEQTAGEAAATQPAAAPTSPRESIAPRKQVPAPAPQDGPKPAGLSEIPTPSGQEVRTVPTADDSVTPRGGSPEPAAPASENVSMPNTAATPQEEGSVAISEPSDADAGGQPAAPVSSQNAEVLLATPPVEPYPDADSYA